MQFNGIGQGHDSERHHVTNCMYDHTHYRKREESANSGGGSMEAQAMEMMRRQEGEPSLSAWLDRMLGSGKRFFRGIWNGDGGAGNQGGKADAVLTTAQTEAAGAVSGSAGQGSHQPDASSTVHISQVAAASTAVPLPQPIQDNPYFSAVENRGGENEGLLQKIRVKFKDITGQLAGHLPGKFFSAQNSNSFQAKQEKPRENLRKHSRFRADKLEIDCFLTDDSYLLDSYDRKGEYSKLSAEK